MDPFFNHLAGEQHAHDLIEQAERIRAARDSGFPAQPRSVTVRYFEGRDLDAIRALAALEGRPEPDGAVLVADVGGRVVAALPLDDREPIADPFTPTADVVALLKLRAAQVARPRRRPPRGLIGRLPLARRASAA
ncbi:MAG: hypothetical protein IRZ21_01050 [Thermoleophilaceae bacterium]|nr:hypothetical protein [Thermoleophilaceae bacterium]